MTRVNPVVCCAADIATMVAGYAVLWAVGCALLATCSHMAMAMAMGMMGGGMWEPRLRGRSHPPGPVCRNWKLTLHTHTP